MARRQGPDEVAVAFSSEAGTGSRQENASNKEKTAQHARNPNPRGSRPPDDGLQFLPLLRGSLRGISGDGDAPLVFRRRPQLSRQSVPCLRRLLHRLSILAAARIQRQRAEDAGRRARRFLGRLCLAARLLRPVRAQRPCHQPHRRPERRRVHFRFCRCYRPPGAGRCPHRPGRVLRADAAQCDGRLVRRGVPLCDRSAGDGRARVLARYRRAGRHECRAGLALAGDEGRRAIALSRRRRRRLLQRG